MLANGSSRDRLLRLVRTHCGLGRICGSRRILKRRDHERDDLRQPRAGLLGFEAVTCGSHVPDSPSTRHEFRDKSQRHEAGRKPSEQRKRPSKDYWLGPVGLEPTTYGLEGRCSAAFLQFWFVRTLADCGRFQLS